MSFEKIVEEQIRRAIADGEFENLRGKGKALELESYFQTPEPLRMAYSMLKSGKFVPEEVRMMQEIDAARQELSSGADGKRATQLEREIQQMQLSLNVLLERGTVSMARATAKDSAETSFFICLGRQKSLDEKYTIFGKVLSGMDVVKKIAAVPLGKNDQPKKRIEILRAGVIEVKP